MKGLKMNILMWLGTCLVLGYLALWLWLWGEVMRKKASFEFLPTAKWVGVMQDKYGRVVFISPFPCMTFGITESFEEFRKRNPNVVA